MATAPVLDPDAEPTPAPTPTPTPAPTPTPTPAPTPTPEPAPAAANDDWRTRIAGEDADLLKFLGRHGSEAAFAKEAKDNLAAIRGGKFIKPLSDDPSESEVAEYRKQLAIPDKPEGYVEKLPDGLVIGEADKPFVDEFLSVMHGVNAPPKDVHAALGAYYTIIEKQTAAATEADAAAKRASEDALREEWGGDYRRNINIVDGLLETLDADVRDALTTGYDANGVSLGNNAAVVKFLASIALERNPTATVVPGSGATQLSTIEGEIAEIKKVMRDNRAEYNRNQKMQDRYLDLLSAQEKLKAR